MLPIRNRALLGDVSELGLEKWSTIDKELWASIRNLAKGKTMAPMKMGWHIKLIDTDTLETIWEINEFYDAGNIHVAAAAEAYYETQLSAAFRKPDPELVLASPRLFGQYTLDSVFSTLPPRK